MQKFFIVSQEGGIMPREIQIASARAALPMIHESARKPVRFETSEYSGCVSTKGVYSNLGAFFGLIVTVVADFSSQTVKTKMLLSPNLKLEDFEEAKGYFYGQIPLDMNIADLETAAMN